MIEEIIKQYEKIHSNTLHSVMGSNVTFDGSQILEEFTTAWDCIDRYYKKSNRKHLSFLEVGAYRGLWGMAFGLYCIQNNIEGTYVTITMIDEDDNNQHLYKSLDYLKSIGIKTDLINLNTSDVTALDRVNEIQSSYNIVFIDAGHRYEEVLNDIQKFVPLCDDVLLFHDIRPKEMNDFNGVYEAIKASKIHLDEEIVTNENVMGIGIKYIK